MSESQDSGTGPDSRTEQGGIRRGRCRPKVDPFNVADLIRRARRNADLSQRDLARALGVSPSTIMRAERDGGSVTLQVLMAALAQGGIELAAIDEAGDQVIIMRPDALRDRAHRKLPAHLDAWVGPVAGRDARGQAAGAQPPSLVRFAKRRRRDQRRSEHLDFLLYHPAPEDVEIARRREESDRPVWPHLRAMQASLRAPLPECTCSDECVEIGMACPPACPCQCEAADPRFAPSA